MNSKISLLILTAILCIKGRFFACPYGSRIYTVQAGETFYSIVTRYGTTAEAVTAANPYVDPRYLVVGQSICLPINTNYNTGYNAGYNSGYVPISQTGYVPTAYNPNGYNPSVPPPAGYTPTGYNNYTNTNTGYSSNTYYGINQFGQYNSYYNTNCKNYVVRSGDTCSSLAAVSSNFFYQQNLNINCNNLEVGQSVCLPYGSNYGTIAGYHSGCSNYQVRIGDTCASLASQAGVSLFEFNNLNGYLSCNNLQVGQVVCMPWGNAGTSMNGYSFGNRCYGRQYTVQYGDDCRSIAQRYGTTYDQLQACNGLNCNTLQVGQVINF